MSGVKPDQHFMRDLRIAGLVSANQAEAIATQHGGEAVDQKEDSKGEEHGDFARGGPARQPFRPLIGGIRSGWFQGCFHFQQFSNRSESPAALSKTTISARLRAVLARSGRLGYRSGPSTVRGLQKGAKGAEVSTWSRLTDWSRENSGQWSVIREQLLATSFQLSALSFRFLAAGRGALCWCESFRPR